MNIGRWDIVYVRIVLVLAAAGLALATVFALTARAWWAFDLFSHFRLQYAVIAVVLCAVAIAVRAYPTAAVLAVVAILHGWTIKDVWIGGLPRAVSGIPLRIASANVLSSNPSPGKVLEFIRASNADIVILVEAEGGGWREALSAIGGIYPNRAPNRWEKGAPVILFSQHPIVGETVLRPTAGERPYVAARIAVGAETVTVVGVHAVSPSPTDPSETHERNLQLDDIAAIVDASAGPVIVAGDFNTTPWSPHFRDLLSSTSLRNAALGQGYVATWPSFFWSARIPIDHILVKGPVAISDVNTGPAIGSDHLPLVADLRIVDTDLATPQLQSNQTPLP